MTLNAFDKTYHQSLERVLAEGEERLDRTGTGTVGVFDAHLSFDISTHFPLITTKRVHIPSVIHELLWFISGNTNIQYLTDHKVKIWNAWADDNGDLGPVYGRQWRHWTTPDGRVIDQLQNVISAIQKDPFSRRHIVSAWNVGQLDKMALPPCHLLFQFHVTPSGYLNCKLFQRSCDAFLGVPFNIASYSLLTYMVAKQCNLKPGRFVLTGTDFHIYNNHLDAVKTQLERSSYPAPTVSLLDADSIDDYTFDHIKVKDYQYHPTIKAPISV